LPDTVNENRELDRIIQFHIIRSITNTKNISTSG
jgi:hypothetical protein